jgi:hypothetical protein
MNIVAVKVNRYEQEDANTVTVPVATPDLAEVRALASRLHQIGKEFSGQFWGWPVQYDPELNEDEAAFQIPDKKGGYWTEHRPFWSPASFTIGESGVWFFSMLWENGSDRPPAEFLDTRNRVV